MDYDICMIVNNSVTNDARVKKEAAALATQGWRVLVLGINAPANNLKLREDVDGYTIKRVRFPTVLDHLAYIIKRGALLRHIPFLLLAPLVVLTNRINVGTKERPKKIYRIPLSFLRRLRQEYEIHIQWIFSQELSRLTSRVYHAHDFPALLILEAAEIIGAHPFVYDSHELYFDRTPPDLPAIASEVPNAEQIEKEAQLARLAAGVITVGDFLAEVMSERWGVAKPLVIRNAADLRVKGQVEQSYPPRKGKTKLVVHSGNITYGRHLTELVESLNYINQEIVLVLMGTSRPYVLGPLLERATEFGVRQNIEIIPAVSVENIYQTLTQADLGIALITTSDALSYKYSLPNKFFEYIAAGLPILCSRAPEMANLVDKYGLGLSCDETDPKAIARGIEHILSPQNYKGYKQNVLEAQIELSWENEEKKLIQLYKQLLPGETSLQKNGN